MRFGEAYPKEGKNLPYFFFVDSQDRCIIAAVLGDLSIVLNRSEQVAGIEKSGKLLDRRCEKWHGA
jgi:hypothetical protein